MGLEAATVAWIAAAVAVGATYYATTLVGDDANTGTTVTKQGTHNSRNRVYGRAIVSSTAVYSNVRDDRQNYRCDVFSVGGIGPLYLRNVWIDDKKMFPNDIAYRPTGDSQSVGMFYKGSMSPAYQHGGDFAIQWRSGTATQQAAFLALANSDGEWTENHRGALVPHLVVKAGYSTEPEYVIFGDRYNVRVLVDSEEVFDPRTGLNDGPSSNVALAIRDFLTNTYYGLGISTEYINDDSVIFCANKCEKYGLEINSEVDLTQSFADILSDMLACMDGALVVRNGQLELLFEDIEYQNVYEFNGDNMLGDFKVSPASTNGYHNAVSLTFKSHVNLENEDTYLLPADTINDPRIIADGSLETKDIKLPYVIDAYEEDNGAVSRTVKWLANRHYHKGRYATTCSFDVDLLEYPELTIWSVVGVTNEIYQWNSKRFRVMSMKQSITSDKLNIATVNLTEYDDSIYLGTSDGVTGSPMRPRPVSVAAPSGLTFNLESYTTEGYGTLSWTPESFTNNTSYDIEYKLSTSEKWVRKATRHVGESFEFYGLKREPYDFRIRTHDTVRGYSDWVNLDGQDVGVLYVLPTVTGLKVNVGTADFVISWDDMKGVTLNTATNAANPEKAGATGTIKDVFSHYEVIISDNGTEKARYNTAEHSFTYTRELNAETGLTRHIDVQVIIHDVSGGFSAPAEAEGLNHQVSAPKNVSIINVNGNSILEWDPATDRDFAGTVVHVSKTSGFTPGETNLKARLGGESSYLYNWDDSDKADRYIRVAHYDTFGEVGLRYSEELVLSYVSAAANTYHYIKPVNGTALKNGEGTLTVEAHRITGGADILLTTGVIQLYLGTTPLGHTAVFDKDSINGSVVIELKDDPAGTVLDTITLVDVTDGIIGKDGEAAVYGSVSVPILTWVQAPQTTSGVDGAWSPTATTTSVVATFYKGGSAVKTKTVPVTRAANGNLSTGTHTGASEVTVVIGGANTPALTISFEYAGVTVSETIAAIKGALKGANGAVGEKGNKHYYMTGSAWSDSAASTFVTVSNGDQLVEWDVVTIHDASVGFSQTRYWTGTKWSVVGQVIDGNQIVHGTVRADAIDVDDLFAKDITATGKISGAHLLGARVEASNPDSTRAVLLDSDSDSPLLVTSAGKRVLGFDSDGKLAIDAGLAVGTINDPSVFSEAIWRQIRAPLSTGSSGGSFAGPDFIGNSASNVVHSTVEMYRVNKESINVAFRFEDAVAPPHNNKTADWTINIHTSIRPTTGGGDWTNRTLWHSQLVKGSMSKMSGAMIVGTSFSREGSVAGITDFGDVRVEIQLIGPLNGGQSSQPSLTNVTVIQEVTGGGAAGEAFTLNGYDGSHYLNFNNFTGTVKTSSFPSVLRDIIGGDVRTPKAHLSSEGSLLLQGATPQVRFLPDGANDAAGIRFTSGTGNAGELEFWTSDDYAEPFVWRAYDIGLDGTGTREDWMSLDRSGLSVKKVTIGNCTLSQENGASQLTVGNSSGQLHMGANNTSWAHFYTDRPAFYFDKEINAKTGFTVYGTSTTLSSTTLDIQGKQALRGSDSWLRINESSTFSAGIYTGSSRVRSDNRLEVGSEGSKFLAATTVVRSNVPVEINSDLNVSLASGTAALFNTTGDHCRVAMVGNNSDNGAFRIEAYSAGTGDLRIQTCLKTGAYSTSGTAVGTIAQFYRNGNVTINREVTAQDFIATSDRRVKTNLIVIPDALKKVHALTGYTYLQTRMNANKAGLIAQDLEAVLPEGVSVDKDGLKQVSYAAPIALLIEAVKELSQTVTHQKECINELKRRLNGAV